ncbi:hypothetical protein EPN16_04170 [bacterium]|nr:MAG: hypothetical protein EPN16_04170 [bacterium]
MSIIYEALKKTQASPESARRETLPKSKDLINPKPSLFKKQAGLAASGAVLGILFTWIITHRLPATAGAPVPIGKTRLPTPLSLPKNSKAAQQKALSAAGSSRAMPHLLLDGIVLSEDGNIAMINGQICKAGDEIEGAKIVRITSSQVTLGFRNQEIVLNNR